MNKKQPIRSEYLDASEVETDPDVAKFLEIAHWLRHNAFLSIKLDNKEVRNAIIRVAKIVLSDHKRRARSGRPANPNATPATVARRERYRRAKKRKGKKEKE